MSAQLSTVQQVQSLFSDPSLKGHIASDILQQLGSRHSEKR